MSDRALSDPGLQPERTALAWRRTGLSIVVGSLLAARVLSTWVGALALAAAAVALILGIAVLIAGEARYRVNRRVLGESAGVRVPLSGAGMIAVVASAVFSLGVLAVVVVLVSALTRR